MVAVAWSGGIEGHQKATCQRTCLHFLPVSTTEIVACGCGILGYVTMWLTGLHIKRSADARQRVRLGSKWQIIVAALNSVVDIV